MLETTSYATPAGLQPPPGLAEGLQRYFDLMYDCDTSRFESVFVPTVRLHGFRDGTMVAWSAEVYRDILNKRDSPKSRGAARADELLMIDRVADDMAFTKVRLQINGMTFVDYLTWHRIDGVWLVTSKGFDLQSTAELAASSRRDTVAAE